MIPKQVNFCLRARYKGKQTSIVESQKEPPTTLPRLPETWVWTKIGELESFIGSGITPRGGKRVYRKEGIPFIRSQNVYPDGLHLENVAYITPRMHAEMKRTQVRSNDVLLNITGASIGRSTYIPEGFSEANVNQHVSIIRTGWWIFPAYLSHFLNSPKGQDQIYATESGVTREGLNYTQIRSLWIPLAPIAEQKRIVSKLKEAFSITEQIEATVKKTRGEVERIDQAILAKAFRGELTQRDPNDEPAETLLQRIKSSAQKNQVQRDNNKKVSVEKKSAIDEGDQSIFSYLLKNGETSVQKVFEASGKSTSDFWDELEFEIENGRLEQVSARYSLSLLYPLSSIQFA